MAASANPGDPERPRRQGASKTPSRRGRPPAPARRGGKGAASHRPALLRFVDGLGPTEIVIFAATIAVGVWAWFGYVLVPQARQDFPTFTIVLCVASGLGALLQVCCLVFLRSPGSLRDRIGFRSVQVKGVAVVFWAPPILLALVFLAVTPPGTSAAGFDPGMSIYQVIFVTALICLIFTALGALVVFSAIVLPVTWIVIAMRPQTARDRAEPAAISRAEYLYGGLTVLCAVGFGISMNAVSSDVDDRFTRLRMLQQLLSLVTLQGNAVASILAVLFAVCIVVLVVLSNRATRQRRARELDELIDPSRRSE